MRTKLFELADCLELVFLNPLDFVSTWQETKISWELFSKWIAFFSAISLAIGSSFISPPYTKGFLVGIVMSSIANFFILLLLPVILGSIVDYWAQKKERKGNARMMVNFSGIAISVFMLYTPIAIVFQSLGFSGLGGSFSALILVFGGFVFLNARGVKYIYDLKDRDSLKFAFLTLMISFIYPMVFNFYLTSYFLNFTL